MPLKVTTKVRRKYSLSTARSNNQAWVKFTVRPSSNRTQLIIRTMTFIILNIATVLLIGKQVTWNQFTRKLVMLAVFFFSLAFSRRPTVESFTVYRDYGVQVTKIKGLLVFPEKWSNRWLAQSKFIPRDQILDIVINEGFVRGFQVVFYLAVIVKESKKLELLFSVCFEALFINPRVNY